MFYWCIQAAAVLIDIIAIEQKTGTATTGEATVQIAAYLYRLVQPSSTGCSGCSMNSMFST